MHRPASAPDEPRANTWSVYVLRCRDGALYTGITNDLPRRLATHNAGRGARFTRGRLPVELAWSLDKLDPTHARRLEYAIKQLTRAQKLCLLDGTLLPRLEEDRWTLAPPPTARTRTRRTRTATATATATSTRTGMRTGTGTGTGTSTRTGTRTREG